MSRQKGHLLLEKSGDKAFPAVSFDRKVLQGISFLGSGEVPWTQAHGSASEES